MSISLTRRTALGLFGSAAIAPALAQAPLQAGPALPPAIDIHHHLLPPFYKPVAGPVLQRFATNVAEVMQWTPERSLAAMDRAGVGLAVLSVSAPGVDFGRGERDVDLARRCNDYMAELVRGYPDRFRFFAAVPMPQTAPAAIEATRAIDRLGAKGVGLISNYEGRYLGDAAFAPLFDELNRRRAIVYVHPGSARYPGGIVADVADPLIELPVDTGRTIASLLWSGTLSRCPDIRFVFSHGGGVFPMVAQRVQAMGMIDPALAARVPEGPRAALARIYVDTASVENRPAMEAVRAWLADDHILYGTDYPWGDPQRALGMLAGLGLPPAVLDGIRRRNAAALLG